MSTLGRVTGDPEDPVLLDLLDRQEGVFSRQQALTFLDKHIIRRRIDGGRWRAVHRGVYVTHNGPLTNRQSLWVASLAVGGGEPAALAGVTALQILGLRRFSSDTMHLVVAPARRERDPPPGVVVHRSTHLPADDVHQTGNPPCTRAARSVIDAAAWARTPDEARTIIAMSFQQGLVAGDRIEHKLAAMPVVRRRALILRTAADARGGSQTLSELDLLSLCRRFGLPEPTRQILRRDRSGRVRYLDAYFEQWRVRIEIDGSHHTSADQWWRDMDRHNRLSVRGEILLRFPAWLVREQPDVVAAQIATALIEAGWRRTR